MLQKTFSNLPAEGPDRIVVGELFIEGNKLKNQIDTKKPGDPIVYFKIIKVHDDGKRYEYIQVFDVLEEEK